MKQRFLSALLALVLAASLTVPVLAADTDPVAEGSFGGHRYEVYDTGMTWTAAARFCQEKGGHLATVTTEAE